MLEPDRERLHRLQFAGIGDAANTRREAREWHRRLGDDQAVLRRHLDLVVAGADLWLGEFEAAATSLKQVRVRAEKHGEPALLARSER